QRGETLDGDQRAAGEGDEPDDGDGAADDGHRPCAHTDLGDQPQQLTPVMPKGVADHPDRLHHEPGDVADRVQPAGRCADPTLTGRIGAREPLAENSTGFYRHISAPFRTEHRWW